MKAGLHLLVYLAAGLLGLALVHGGAWALAPIGFVFVLLPILDGLAGVDTGQRTEPGRRWLWDAPLYAWVPVQLGCTVAGLTVAASGERGLLETGLLLAGVGVLNGSGGINIAHELMHRSERLPRAVAELLMTGVAYPHFCVEHVHGHHRWVATHPDPATARLGESLPRFLCRTLIGSFASAWRIEARRAERERRGPWTLRDGRLRQPLLLGAVIASAGAAFGTAGLAGFAVQSAVAVLLLESINYVEHYGLSRRELSPGCWERVRPEHSWNGAHLVSNGYLFNLERHSDHHQRASRPWEQLRHHADAPQLPASYAAMLLLAWVPPLWFRVMDHRAHDWNQRRPQPATAS